MVFRTLFFDLDDTLYPSDSGLWLAIKNRMIEYMERMGLPKDEIPLLRQYFVEHYGTTLRGLQQTYQIDVDEYLRFVHELPLKDYLHADPGLHEILSSLPQPCWIFTNSDRAHVQRVLGVLQLEDCFDGIIDIRLLDYVCKPDLQAYQQAVALAGLSSVEGYVFFDDAPRNLAPAKQLGFTTVLIKENTSPGSADFAVRSLHQLRQTMPQLWQIVEQPAHAMMKDDITNDY